MADLSLGIDFTDETPGLEVTARALAGLIPEVPEVMYHYTSSRGLLGILASRSMWASDTRFLNDKTEVGHGAQLCREQLADAGYDGDFGKECQLLVQHLRPERFIHFAASFCEEADLVPQWRGYGAGGAGFAIGVDVMGIEAVSDEFMLLRVRYREEDKRAAIGELIAAHANAWAKYDSQPVARKREVMKALGTSLLTGLTALSVSFKPEVFEYEREWRLVNSISPRFPGQMEGVRFRPSGSAIIPYVELSLGSGADGSASSIREVWIGPTQQNEASASAVETFCAVNQLAVSVHLSRAPLRF